MVEQQCVLVTGAAGFVGERVTAELAARGAVRVVATDLRPPAQPQWPQSVRFESLDIRDPSLAGLMAEAGVNAVVHLASVVTPPPGMSRREQEAIDVGGTLNVFQACQHAGVRHLTVTSSGAAYGYHADNPVPLRESDPLRGNAAFAYADHKRRIEQLLGEWRRDYPQLRQLVLRPGTILGPAVNNQITALFERPFLLAVAGSDSPFVFISDEDAVNIIVRGVLEQRAGIYNLAGEGWPGMPELARLLGKPLLPIPASLIRGAIRLLRLFRLTGLEPVQVDFLRYRPVLDNTALREEFGYTPTASREVFEQWARARGLLATSDGEPGQ